MQFLPAEWAQYGVDANGDGFKDPYNPADDPTRSRRCPIHRPATSKTARPRFANPN